MRLNFGRLNLVHGLISDLKVYAIVRETDFVDVISFLSQTLVKAARLIKF